MSFKASRRHTPFALELGDDPDWLEQARCNPQNIPAGVKPSCFTNAEKVAIPAALSVCESCPVREQCLEWALKKPELGGLWGGLTGEEREQVKRRREAREALGV